MYLEILQKDLIPKVGALLQVQNPVLKLCMLYSYGR